MWNKYTENPIINEKEAILKATRQNNNDFKEYYVTEVSFFTNKDLFTCSVFQPVILPKI